MKIYLLISTLFLAQLVISQIEDVDSVVYNRAKKLSIKEVLIKRMDLDHDTLLIKRFDAQGNMIESISPAVRNNTRSVFGYDSLVRKTKIISYNQIDTTKIDSERRWHYLDSNQYKEEYFGENGQIYETKIIEQTSSIDTIWITELETNHYFNTHSKHVSRYRSIGDTLLISEFISFDKEGNIHGIDVYYDLRKQNDAGQIVRTSGQYVITSDTWDIFHQNMDALTDFYNNPEKYLQKQLDGEYRYEYGEYPHTYEVYNAQNQLIQNGNWPFKELYEYNSNGQLVKNVMWGENWLNDEEIVPHKETIYEYDSNGLPTSITSKSIERNNTITYLYEYLFER